MWLKRVFLPGRMPGQTFNELKDLQEVQSMLSERVKEWTREWKEQGIREGKREGMREGIRECGVKLLFRLLDRRFGPVEKSVRQKIERADVDTLLIWGERILIAESIDEVIRD